MTRTRKTRMRSATKILAVAALGVFCSSETRGAEVDGSTIVKKAIKPVKVQQRYPWNGLVDIEIFAASNATLNLSAKDLTTQTTLPVKTLTLNGETFTKGETVLTNESVHLVWDAGTDVGSGFVLTNAIFYASITGTEQDLVKHVANYMVIDISEGTTAETYPVSYFFDEPEDGWTEAEGWTDEYKTTKIVMRRIPKGTFTMGSPTNELGRIASETQHAVTISSDFWVGVFEMTQAQYTNLVATANPSGYKGDVRPVENVSYNTIFGETGPISNLIAKTGLAFTLPTDAQWEYACRAGTTGAWNNGTTITNTTADANLSLLGRYGKNASEGVGGYDERHTTVGAYTPNAWGLYDMHGNVFELCLDWYEWNLGSDDVTDPKYVSDETGSRVYRGGSWYHYASLCRSAYRSDIAPSSSNNYIGFRLACPVGQN